MLYSISFENLFASNNTKIIGNTERAFLLRTILVEFLRGVRGVLDCFSYVLSSNSSSMKIQTDTSFRLRLRFILTVVPN